MNFSDVIKEINSDKRLKPDLLKTENGNNFRAVSESAILDVIEPVFQKYGIYYTTAIKESHLEVKEAYGKKGKKLQFIYHLVLLIHIFCIENVKAGMNYGDPVYEYNKYLICTTESVGMGIDDCDKAAGKAYTYALKYGLLKLFRLRFGDDPDFEVSTPLHTEKPKEEKQEEIKPKKSKPAEKSRKGEKASGMDKPMTEPQRDYILGMMKSKKVEEREVLEKFGVEPSRDEFIPMPTARAIIKWLENDEFLPF